MCKYCENLFSGNASENLNRAEIEVNGVYVGTEVTFVSEEKGRQASLCTALFGNNGKIIAEDKVDIGWCPVCGRVLNTEVIEDYRKVYIAPQ